MGPERSSNLLEATELVSLRAATWTPTSDSKAHAYSIKLERCLKIASEVGENGKTCEITLCSPA